MALARPAGPPRRVATSKVDTATLSTIVLAACLALLAHESRGADSQQPQQKPDDSSSQSAPPADSELRLWTDKTGQRHVCMKLIAIDGEKLSFQKADGHPAVTTVSQLSDADRSYVASLTAQPAASLTARPAASNTAQPAANNIAKPAPSLTSQRAASNTSQSSSNTAPPASNNIAQPAPKNTASPTFDRSHFESALARLLVPDIAPLAKHENQLEPLARLALEQVGLLDQAAPPTASPTPATPVYIRISRPFLEDYVQRQVRQTHPVKECILGTSVVGTANVIGQTHLILESCSRQAVAQVAFNGTTASRTTGYNGPAILHSVGNSVFEATKRIVLSDSGLEVSPAQSRAQTSSRTLSIDSLLPGLRGRIVRWIAWRRVAALRSLADAISSRLAAARIGAGLDREIGDTIADVRKALRSGLPELPLDRDGLPHLVRFSSTAECVEVLMVRQSASASELAMRPPPVAGNPDLALRVHRTMLVSTITSPQLAQSLLPLLSELLRAREPQDALTVLPPGEIPPASSITLSFDTNWLSFEFTDAKRQPPAAATDLPLARSARPGSQ